MNMLLVTVFVAGLAIAACAESTTPTPEHLSHTSDGDPVPIYFFAKTGTTRTWIFIPENDDDFVFIIVPKETLKANTSNIYTYLHNDTAISYRNISSGTVDATQSQQITSPDRGSSLTVTLQVLSTATNEVGFYASTFPSPPKNYTVAETISTYGAYHYHSAGYPAFAYGRVWQTWQFTPESSNIALVFTHNGVNQFQVDNKTASLTVFAGAESANSVLKYDCTDKTNKTLCPDSYTAPVGETLTVRFETTEAIINGDHNNPAGVNFFIIGSKQYDPAAPVAGATTTEPAEVNGTTTEVPTTTKGAGSLSPLLAISGVICILPLLRN
uniref:CUB_2 domain-containing protein n=1 Tax=Panagrellus redivivus TaxID=6233 RepID=A0A7E4WCM7_PANRE